MDQTKRKEYQEDLNTLAETKGRLAMYRNREHSGRTLTAVEQNMASDCHDLIKRVTDRLKSEGVLDSWEMLTPDALRLELRLR